MGSREEILTAVQRNQPPSSAKLQLPLIEFGLDGAEQYVIKLKQKLEEIGSTVFRVRSFDDVVQFIKKERGKGKTLINTIEDLPYYNVSEFLHSSAWELSGVDTVLVQSRLGVVENGAVWLNEQDMVHRLLPFVCSHLVVVLEEKHIVEQLGEAYQRIGSNLTSYGIMLAGPSKTADIEQSLVIGAHGPLYYSVYLIKAI